MTQHRDVELAPSERLGNRRHSSHMSTTSSCLSRNKSQWYTALHVVEAHPELMLSPIRPTPPFVVVGLQR